MHLSLAPLLLAFHAVVNSIVFASVELPSDRGTTSSVIHCRKSILVDGSYTVSHGTSDEDGVHVSPNSRIIRENKKYQIYTQ